MIHRVPFIRPSMPSASALVEDFGLIAEANWYSNFGPFERQFRHGIAEYIGATPSQVTTVNNATTGLLAALSALLPRGNGSDSIAIASFTFAAGAQAALWRGYQPAWIDIDACTLQPSLSSFNELIKHDSSVRAIILTNTFGIANEEVTLWESAAQDLGIPLVIDSAAGFGSQYRDGTRLGSHGDCEIFSFHATKPFAIGEGGAVICADDALASKMREFTNFGLSGVDGANAIGLNGKLQEFNAAMGIRQLDTFDQSLDSRRSTFEKYTVAFESLPLQFPEAARRSSLCFASAVLDGPQQANVLASLEQHSIEARSYYNPPLHLHPWFAASKPKVSLEQTESVARRIVSLPVLPDMTDTEIQRVADAVREAL